LEFQAPVSHLWEICSRRKKLERPGPELFYRVTTCLENLEMDDSLIIYIKTSTTGML